MSILIYTVEKIKGTEIMVNKKTGLIVGGTLAAAVLIGGGAYAATQFMGDNELNLAGVTPSSSFMYAELDLDPSGGQKLNALDSIKKVEELANSMTDKEEDKMNFEESVYEAHFKDIPLEEINEWSAGQMAVTSVENTGDKYASSSQQPIAIYEITDMEKAQATVDKVISQEKSGDDSKRGISAPPKHYEVFEGYMVVANTKEAYDAYQAEMNKGILSDNPQFIADREKFDDDFGYFWVDLGLAQEVAGKESVSNPTLSPYAGATSNLTDTEDSEITGRMAGSLSFQNKSIDLTVQAIDMTLDGEKVADTTIGKDPKLLGELDKKTIGALVMAEPSENLKKSWKDLDKTVGKEEVAQIETSIEEATGAIIPDEWEKILGSELAIGISMDAKTDTTPENVKFEALTKGDTSTAWKKVADALNPSMDEYGIDVVEKDGTTRIAKIGYDAPTEKLSAHELYNVALPDLNKANGAFWLNIDALIEAMPEESKKDVKVDNVGVVGMTSHGEDGNSTVKLRWAFN